jgi:hypothetical protein
MSVSSFIGLVRHPLKFRLFLLSQLPSAYFSGVRVREMDADQCVVSVPYKWFTRNPFRSTYFACMAMAAEMSTGALAMAHLYKRSPAVSMLVTKIEGEYFQKAKARTYFTCEAGKDFAQAIEEAVSTGEARELQARSTGRDGNGNIIAIFTITWSFKKKR